jgi:hypothetical protein
MATIMNGGYAAWNMLALEMREAKPVLLGRLSPNTPASLKHGIVFEKMAAAKFWELHPEYEMSDPKWVPWFDSENAIYQKHCGVSVDRMLTKEGVTIPLEIKCPYDPDIHQMYRKHDVVPWTYWPQVMWEMIVSDAQTAWFVSFDPRESNDEWGWHEMEVPRDEEYENLMMQKVNRFLETYLMGEKFVPDDPTVADIKRIFT